MRLSIIVAVAENYVIGKDNQLLWHLPADLKYFKNLTMGSPIIMGRKTFESIGRPLPGRTTIIISRNAEYCVDGCLTVNTLESAIEAVQGFKEAFIIGGAQIYSQAMALAHRIYYTKVHETFEGDCFFPVIDDQKWKLISQSYNEPDDKNKFPYSFLIFDRLT